MKQFNHENKGFIQRYFSKKSDGKSLPNATFKKSGTGFSLIELLVVISIIGILMIVSFPHYQSIRRQLALQRAASKLAQDIRMVQEMAMSARELPTGGFPSGGYGVYFVARSITEFIIYADVNGNGRYNAGEEIRTISLEQGIYIQDIVVANKLSINFIPPDPETTIKWGTAGEGDEAEITLCIEDSDCSVSSNKKKVKVNGVGLIEIID